MLSQTFESYGQLSKLIWLFNDVEVILWLKIWRLKIHNIVFKIQFMKAINCRPLKIRLGLHPTDLANCIKKEEIINWNKVFLKLDAFAASLFQKNQAK